MGHVFFLNTSALLHQCHSCTQHIFPYAYTGPFVTTFPQVNSQPQVLDLTSNLCTFHSRTELSIMKIFVMAGPGIFQSILSNGKYITAIFDICSLSLFLQLQRTVVSWSFIILVAIL